MKHYYFAFGMNTNLDSMEHRCPGARVLGAARLEGYQFVFRRHADVELCYDSDTWGVLWEIDDDHLDSLDALEGFPTYYIRSRAWVEHAGDWYIAWIYQMADQSYLAEPAGHYVQMCVEGYKQNGVDINQIEQALRECNNYDSYLVQ